jgi:hypothetical protein
MAEGWTVASDEDVTTGYLLASDDLPTDPDALLGVFIVLARREWDALYDPCKLLLSASPARYRMAADGESMEPAGKRRADSRWWVITGLDDAEAVLR